MSIAVLVIRSGLFQGSKYRIRPPFKIGRHPDNHLQLLDPLVSRFHAVIERTDRGLFLTDLDSRNGTWLNGNRMARKQLAHGDEILLGRTSLRFLLEETAQDDEAPLGMAVEGLELPANRFPVRYRTPVKPDFERSVFPQERVPREAAQAPLLRLQTLYQTNMLLSSGMDLDEILQSLLEKLFQTLPADRGVVFLVDPGTQELRVRQSRTRSGGAEVDGIIASRTIIDEVLKSGCGMLIDNAFDDDRFRPSESIVEQDIRSAVCAPLLYKEQPLGMIYLDAIGKTEAFGEDDLRFMMAMATPAALQIRNIQYMDQIARAYLDTMRVLANAIEARDHYTVGHTWRVTRIALAMVNRLGWSSEQRRNAEMGGILHDIGKIAVEDSILRKQGPLTRQEYRKMQLHAEHGARILKDVEFLRRVIPYVLFHQERWDGRGYPFHLKAGSIPIEGRILAVPDAFDAMTSYRPYRKRLSPERAVEEIKRNRGRQFDPKMVHLFLDVWKSGEIPAIIERYDQSQRSVPCPFCAATLPIGESPVEGSLLQCPVCERKCVIFLSEGVWWSKLV